MASQPCCLPWRRAAAAPARPRPTANIAQVEGSGTGDSDTSLYSPFHSAEHPPKGVNYTFYANAKVDELVTRAREVSEAQRDALAALGCDKFQGYLFGRPMPLEVFEAARRDGWLGRPQDQPRPVTDMRVA